MTAAFEKFGLTIEIDFTDGPWTTSPAWTDITKYVMSFTTTLGRQHELQQVNPSTAQIVLTNMPNGTADPGGRFSPWNTGSPYYHSGNGMTPGHPVKITAKPSSTTYNVFYGYTQSWVPSYGSQTQSTVTLNCYDALALLNLSLLDASTYQTQVLADGATAYWECQDPATSVSFADSTGNGHTGTLYGSGYFASTGGALLAQSDACIVFTGTGLMTTSLAPTGSALMFEGWFETSDTAQVLMSWGTATSLVVDNTFLYIDGSGLPTLSTATDGGSISAFLAGSAAVNDGNWHHYAVRVSTSLSLWTLYVDGVLIGTGTGYQWGLGGTQEHFLAGGYWVGGTSTSLSIGAGFTGSMDQVAYYSSALSSSQIANHYELGSAGFLIQDSGARVKAVLDSAGIPSALYSLDTGNVNVAGATSSLNQSTAMAYLQQVVNTERGLLYQDPSGVIQFKNRQYVYTNSTSVNSQVTFTYHVGGGQYYLAQGLVPQEDDTDLWNDIHVSRQGGVVQSATNSTSITNYGRRSLQGYTSLLFTNDTDANDLAEGLAFQYSQPAPRVRSITLASTINAGSTMPYMLGLNLLDRVTVVWKPLDGSSVDFSQQSLVEQVSHSVTPGEWITTLALTPIGTETFGLWGSGTWDTATWGF